MALSWLSYYSYDDGNSAVAIYAAALLLSCTPSSCINIHPPPMCLSTQSDHLHLSSTALLIMLLFYSLHIGIFFIPTDLPFKTFNDILHIIVYFLHVYPYILNIKIILIWKPSLYKNPNELPEVQLLEKFTSLSPSSSFMSE